MFRHTRFRTFMQVTEGVSFCAWGAQQWDCCCWWRHSCCSNCKHEESDSPPPMALAASVALFWQHHFCSIQIWAELVKTINWHTIKFSNNIFCNSGPCWWWKHPHCLNSCTTSEPEHMHTLLSQMFALDFPMPLQTLWLHHSNSTLCELFISSHSWPKSHSPKASMLNCGQADFASHMFWMTS